MPCRYDPTPQEIEESNRNRLAMMDMFTRNLCACLKELRKNNSFFYANLMKNDKPLAEWWQYHEKLDAARKKQEAREREQKELREQALAKLTKKERIALGLSV